jgi:hypothetical protein
MTTQTHAPSARPTTRSARLRRLVAIGSLTPLLAVAACSGDEPITTQGRVSTQSSTADGSTALPTTSASTTTPDEASGPTETALKLEIRDPGLGHVVKPLRMVRNAAWPEGNPVGEESFEIIAVEVEVTTGKRYSASVLPWMFALTTTKNTRVAPTTEFGKLLGDPLPTVPRNKIRKGWLYYKVDRGSGSAVMLQLKRPEYRISTTGKTVPPAIFSVSLSK